MCRETTDYFRDGLDPDQRLERIFQRNALTGKDRERIQALLQPLREHHPPSFDHSVRVGYLASEVKHLFELPEPNLLIIGSLIHDAGKICVSTEALDAVNGLTDAQWEEVVQHPVVGMHLARRQENGFLLSSELVVRHHTLQLRNPYPKIIPRPAKEYDPELFSLVDYYVAILAGLDMFDALHRKSTRSEGPTTLDGEEIKQRMLSSHVAQQLDPAKIGARDEAHTNLIQQLYEAGVFRIA